MEKLVIIILLFANSLIAQTTEQEISLVTDNGKIEGTLLCPSSPNEIPLAIIISGSGPTDRNGNNPMMSNNSLKMLAEGLFENNIATIRYDKRGIGKSKEAGIKESDLRFEQLIKDTEGWIDTFKKDSRFSEIIIIGHSEGSTIGMIASQSEKVSKFISIAGPGVKASNKIKEQLKTQAPSILDQTIPIFEKLEKGQTVKEIPPMLFSIFRPSVQPYLISWFKYDPQKEIAKVDKPILIIQGTTDVQVSVSDAEKLFKANEKAKKQIIEEMNHVLKKAEMDITKNMETYSNPDLPLKKGLVNIIVDFIKKENNIKQK